LFSAYDVTPVLPPSAPVLSASAGSGQVSLSWTPPASDGGSPITGYELYRGTAPGGETAYQSLPATASDYTDTAVTDGTTYYYTLAAVNADGTGAVSSEVSALPATPPGVSTLAAKAKQGQVTLTWTVPGDGGAPITGYELYRGTSPGGEAAYQSLPAAATSYLD
ncbi:MAG: fibronectin type III domain-containing protein, partial [Mycobacteriales bacterium]